MIHAFRLQRIEKLRAQVAAGKSAEVSPIVDTSHDKSEDHDHDDPLLGLLADAAASGASAVIKQRTNQTTDGRRRAHGELCTAHQRKKSQIRACECARYKSGDAG